MPTTRSSSSATRKATPIQRKAKPSSAPAAAIYPVTPAVHSGTCHSCNALPAGSMEVAAILLVLVFSLSAVLCTSVYANNLQNAKVRALEAQVAAQHVE